MAGILGVIVILVVQVVTLLMVQGIHRIEKAHKKGELTEANVKVTWIIFGIVEVLFILTGVGLAQMQKKLKNKPQTEYSVWG